MRKLRGPPTEETREKLKHIRLGKTYEEIYGKEKAARIINKKSISQKGKRCLEITKQKLREINKGKKQPLEVRLRMRMSHLGKKHSAIWTKRAADSHRGEKSHWWKGGISFGSYSKDWTKELRALVKNRDGFICYLCNNHYLNEQQLSVHHIDYNKLNSEFRNLVTLCKSCHAKTNSNRDYYSAKVSNAYWERKAYYNDGENYV
jgi:5-methylcytosine-specific restriction endonuclease McrA